MTRHKTAGRQFTATATNADCFVGHFFALTCLQTATTFFRDTFGRLLTLTFSKQIFSTTFFDTFPRLFFFRADWLTADKTYLTTNRKNCGSS